MIFRDKSTDVTYAGRTCAIRNYWRDIRGKGRVLVFYPAFNGKAAVIRVLKREYLEAAQE